MAEQKKSWFDVVKSSYVWKSMFRHEYQDTYRNRVLQVSSNVFLHLHPTKIRRHALRLRFTWCMGGITFLLFLILVVTGIILMFYYRPTGEYAYHDMKYLQFDVPGQKFGQLSLVGGSGVEYNSIENDFLQGEGFGSTQFRYPGNAGKVTSYDGGRTDNNLASFFTRANWSLSDKYFASASVRTENRWCSSPPGRCAWASSTPSAPTCCPSWCALPSP